MRRSKSLVKSNREVARFVSAMRHLCLKQVRQFWVNGVRLDHAVDQGRDQSLQRRISAFGDSALHYAIDLANVPVVKGDKNRPLVWKVLVDGPDTDPSRFGDPVGCNRRSASAFEKFDGRIQHRLDGHLGPLLNRCPASCASLRVRFHLGSIDGNVSFLLDSRNR